MRTPLAPVLAFALALALALPGCADAPPAARPTTVASSPAPVATPSGATPTPGATPPPVLGPPVRLDPFLEGFDQPILLTHDGREGIVYVVEQGGTIWRIENGEREVWIDVSADTVAGGERGLLGFAWDPDGERAYVSYTDRAGDSVLERVSGASKAREVLLKVDQPYANHNGGHILFGPDGLLYYGLGDGGSGGDPQGNGQNKDALLGSILRLDVGTDTSYRSAEGNPYGTDVWAKGLRNPWRFSFDRATDDLYIADVGQNKLEEVNFVPAGTGAGRNFGWNVFEGTERYSVGGRTFSEHTPPVAEYTHDDGCSVTGGFVYRGAAHAQLEGVYFFADYCSGKLWGMRQGEGGAWSVVELLDTESSITSFGEDAAGELYVIAHEGTVYRLIATGAALPNGLA